MFSNMHRNAFFRLSLLISAFFWGILFCVPAFCDTPDIYFTYVPPYGTTGNLSGQVTGAAYDDYEVLVYIYVGGWWNKPTWANPTTPIDSNGSWTCNITTSIPGDTYATKIIAFLIPEGSYQQSWEMAGEQLLPANLYDFVYEEIPRRQTDRAIRFSNHNWAVKTGFEGPGPNYFSDSMNNVWVDANGFLRLKITHQGGLWYCSEVISDESFGYGTYVFTIDSRVDLLDRNVVLGLFTWDTYAPQYNYREIDFEFSRWQNPSNDIGQYVIQPWDTPGNIHRFDFDDAGQGATTTHVMTWRPDGIYFKSYHGDFELAPLPEKLIEDWFYAGPDNPPPGGENARINLWLINGLAPSDGLESEIVIKNFMFMTEISDQPGDIDNDTNVNLFDFTKIAEHWLNDDCQIYNKWCSQADLTCDGNVNINDIAAFVQYWLEGR